MRKIKDKDMIGKTIKSIDNKSVNVLKIIFTDGTSLELWAEDAVHTAFGNISGIFVEDNSNSI